MTADELADAYRLSIERVATARVEWRAELADARAEGWTLERIARALGVTRSAVSQMLRR